MRSHARRPAKLTETQRESSIPDMKLQILASVVTLTLLATNAASVVAESAEFTQLKTLVGTWSGSMTMDNGQEAAATTSYELTAGGSAILEKSFVGTPMEMITVYTDDAEGVLQMTHYCMLGNQPKLKLVKSKDNKLFFDLADDASIKVASETHMHSAVFEFNGNNSFVQRWVKYENGKASDPLPMVLNRVK